MNSYPCILYVEDEPDDVLLLRLALKRSGLPNPLAVAVDGVEAIDYLAGRGLYADRGEHPFPGLVLLDLKLPLLDGFEVLAWVRQQPALATLPIVAYTSSSEKPDQAKARALGVTDYVTKKSDINEIAAWLRSLGYLWQQAA